MKTNFLRPARKILTLGVILAASTALTGCLDEDDDSSGGGGGGNSTACANTFFTRYADTYNLTATFNGTGISIPPGAMLTTDIFTEGTGYAVVLDATAKTITLPTDGSDLVFTWGDAGNTQQFCELSANEDNLRIDTDEYSILFQVDGGVDGVTGTADDDPFVNFTLLNAAGFNDDENWTFALPAI